MGGFTRGRELSSVAGFADENDVIALEQFVAALVADEEGVDACLWVEQGLVGVSLPEVVVEGHHPADLEEVEGEHSIGKHIPRGMRTVHVDEVHAAERKFSQPFAAPSAPNVDAFGRVGREVAGEGFPDGRFLSGLMFHGTLPSINAGDGAFGTREDVIEKPAGAAAFEGAYFQKAEAGFGSVWSEVSLEAWNVSGEPINGEGGGHLDERRSHVFWSKGRRNILRTFWRRAFVLMNGRRGGRAIARGR